MYVIKKFPKWLVETLKCILYLAVKCKSISPLHQCCRSEPPWECKMRIGIGFTEKTKKNSESTYEISSGKLYTSTYLSNWKQMVDAKPDTDRDISIYKEHTLTCGIYIFTSIYERETCIWRYKFRTIYCVGGNSGELQFSIRSNNFFKNFTHKKKRK